MASDWHIRPALPSDLPAILEIERSCPEAPHWTDASWLNALQSEPNSPIQRFALVATVPHVILGFAVAAWIAGVAELETIAVSPQARRKGVGRALLNSVMGGARIRGARSMELEVRASSSGAQALYRLCGFAEQARRRAYYRDPVEDAVLMAAELQELVPVELSGEALRRIRRVTKV